jgi:acylphosphatase
MNNTENTRRLVIVGHVQGVGFRYAMSRKATEIGVRGWVRNRADGNVEAIVQGTPEQVARVMAWARQGPRAARVERIDVEPADGSFSEFEIRPTE